MLCKSESRDPSHCLKEGRRVTRCVADVLSLLTTSCPSQFREHWECLEGSNQKFYECRKPERKLNECAKALVRRLIDRMSFWRLNHGSRVLSKPFPVHNQAKHQSMNLRNHILNRLNSNGTSLPRLDLAITASCTPHFRAFIPEVWLRLKDKSTNPCRPFPRRRFPWPYISPISRKAICRKVRTCNCSFECGSEMGVSEAFCEDPGPGKQLLDNLRASSGLPPILGRVSTVIEPGVVPVIVVWLQVYPLTGLRNYPFGIGCSR